MIKNIIFDFGGVIITLDHAKAVESFKQLGIADAEKRLDPYTQGGIFGDLEIGSITADEFLSKLCDIAGHDISYDECRQAWLSYHSELPKRNLDILRQLRKEGYRLILLSNTNPFMMSWAESDEFDGEGNPLSSYFQVAEDASLCVGVEALLGVGDAQLFETFHRLCVVEGDDDSSEVEDNVFNHI